MYAQKFSNTSFINCIVAYTDTIEIKDIMIFLPLLSIYVSTNGWLLKISEFFLEV